MSTSLLEDYLNATIAPIKALKTLAAEEGRDLFERLDYKPKQQMSVIEEEQTDRQGEDEKTTSKQMRREFNMQIRDLMQLHKSFEEIINVSKRGLKDLAEDLMKMEKDFSKLRSQNKEIKEQIKAVRKLSRRENSSDEPRVRPAPSPVKQVAVKQVSRHSSVEKERANWKKLSSKIEECKRKIAVYEQEIKTKDEEIRSLKQTVKEKEKNMKSDQEKAKVKKDNTTLRGQRALLNNQVSSLRKQLAEQTELNSVLEVEVKKLRLELENTNSSLNWHMSNLNEVRNSRFRQDQREAKENQERYEGLIRVNKTMRRCLDDQEEVLETMDKKMKTIEDKWQRQTQRQMKKLAEMEEMLDDKNETILRLKTEARASDKSGYHADMVRVLNKRLAERQEKIRYLEQSLASGPQE